MKTDQKLSGYDYRRDYDWNYAHPPELVEVAVPPMPGQWQFCGLKVDSPLGVNPGQLPSKFSTPDSHLVSLYRRIRQTKTLNTTFPTATKWLPFFIS